MKNKLNILFLIHLFLFVLVVLGWLPRSVVPFWTVALIGTFLILSLEDSILFFVRTIPFFIAIPITSGFDSLNMWRILSIVIFLRWIDIERLKSLVDFRKYSKLQWTIIGLLILSILSIINSTDVVLSLKRIIYYVNLSLIGIVIYDIANKSFAQKLIRNIAIPTILVLIIGFLQLISTYMMDIFRFMDFWGGMIQRNIYGNAWADIAAKANTWLAFYGDRISLRMFSIFPDSHSFPIFVILGLPAILAIAVEKVIANNIVFKGFLKTRGRMIILFVPVAFLGVILSGTRGMWVAGGLSVLWTLVLLFWFDRTRMDIYRFDIFKYIGAFLVIFFMLFAIAYPIFGSSQFQVEKQDSGLFAKRIRSSFDFSETSNARRIEIWTDSIKSIIKHPLLGVGIGNFPVVVKEDLAKAKAGSSAHNLYLHIASEMGIPALMIALYFFWLLLKNCYEKYRDEENPLLLIFFAASLIFIPWNLFYSLTDVAIFDERTFLLFIVTVAIILKNKKAPEGA